MSTFSGLNAAYSGLVAARAGLDVVGQNIANANTEGYTRQRLTTSATSALAPTSMFVSGVLTGGQGVTVDSIARMGNAQFDAQVRSTAASAGFSAVRANALFTIETSFQEPSDNGISAQLQQFWSGWQALANSNPETSPEAALLVTASALTGQIIAGYQAVSNQWTSVRGDLNSMVAELNSSATQVASLNEKIQAIVLRGGNANELIDQRNALSTTISALTGATMTEQSDGTVNIMIGGNALVTGGNAYAMTVSGATDLNALTAGDEVKLSWAGRPTTPVWVEGGEIAGSLSLLKSTTTEGSGGLIAEAAASYNAFAVDLASKVNAVHVQGTRADGTGGHNFFEYDSGNAAQTLRVGPTNANDIASTGRTADSEDLTINDAISKIGSSDDSPATTWASFMTLFGVTTQSTLQAASVANQASVSAVGRQLSNSSVDLDEENVNLLMYQHAYQGAARVMTAVDEMLDTLINRTGLVGR